MSPDTMSSLYPDRPIRPLPKRRLRERLSPEAVESIQYPPIPQLNQPLFSYPCDLQDRPSVARRGSLPQSTGTLDRHRACRKPGLPDSQDSDDEEGPRTIAIAWPSPEVGSRLSQKTDGGHPLVTNPVVSSTSSIDGYDSLENTNNKKKRKIPTAGDHLLNGGSTLSEISGLSISHSASCSDLGGNGTTAAVGNQNSSTSSLLASVQGMSGPGRGRFGRTRNGRSPLRALSDSTHNWARNNGKLRPLPWAPAHGEGSGIISSAIANAGKHAPFQGQENASLLQQNGNTKTSPGSSLFTFTCESQVGGSVVWPSSDTASSSIQSPSPKSSTAYNMQSTQTSPPNVISSFETKNARLGSSGGADTLPSRRKPKSKAARRQKLDDELHRQAQHRKQEAQNHRRNTPNSEQYYKCLYCEYEDLFGEEPWALIRQYELKDRRRRKEEEERKRLIEKAKSRSRKNRKSTGGKSSSKISPSAQASGQHGSDSLHLSSQEHLDNGDETDDDQDGYESRPDGFETCSIDYNRDQIHHYSHDHRPTGSSGNGSHGARGPHTIVGGMNGPSALPTCTCAHG